MIKYLHSPQNKNSNNADILKINILLKIIFLINFKFYFFILIIFLALNFYTIKIASL